ncbi:MAG: glycogen/starch synthase [Patescibacteria group bacterium]
MKRKKLKIFHIASEVEPFSKTGGLASITSSLPRMQKELGHDVSVITPFYEGLINLKDHPVEEIFSEELLINDVKYPVSYLKGYLSKDLPIYFIADKKFFKPREKIYGSRSENSRFFFFDIAALSLIKKLEKSPDIIHCHDWHTGLIPYFLKGRFKSDTFWDNTATLFTIHNLVYQLGHDWWLIPQEKRDDGRSGLPPLHETERVETINFAKRAIMTVDAINAVSETYREEIMTKNFGEDLNRILKNREKRVFGIVNGINYDDYNPVTDPGLTSNYDYESYKKKGANKEWLQKHFKLKIDPNIPIITMTSRVVEQKGFNLLIEVLPTILKRDLQFVIMGDGDKTIVNALEKIQKKFPKKFVLTPFNPKYETSMYAGADIFLLPSRFEPCGINQMIALRYGCIPVVHHIGGLADTIVDFNPHKETGNGFTFKEYNVLDLVVAITRATENYKHPEIWKRLVITGLKEANSWKIPAKKYVDLYRETFKLKKKNEHNGHNGK